LTACEKGLFGPLWQCPNGRTCIYQHTLPAGYVLNKDKSKDERILGISIEELVELEREKLKGVLTPVNEDTFAIWKSAYLEKKCREKPNPKSIYANKRTGKELFMTAPSLFKDEYNSSEYGGNKHTNGSDYALDLQTLESALDEDVHRETE
jgi:hypothetical protein